MGNRGALHDENCMIVWTRQSWRDWLIFLQKLNGRDRTMVKPGNCTELFFYEATSIGARHANRAVSRTLSEARDFPLPKLMLGEVRVKDAMKLVEAAV